MATLSLEGLVVSVLAHPRKISIRFSFHVGSESEGPKLQEVELPASCDEAAKWILLTGHRVLFTLEGFSAEDRPAAGSDKPQLRQPQVKP